MMDNLTTLKDSIHASGNCVNLGRTLFVKNRPLFEWVNNNTHFLPEDCKFTERVYCIVNSICTRVHNDDGETYARFKNMFKGYCVKAAPPIIQVKQALQVKPKKSKLQLFIDRNRLRNANLYTDAAVLGDDYIVCPASNERMVIIRADYITNVLEITVDEYDTHYPNTQKKALAYSRNISIGVNKIDPNTGLTKAQLSSKKAQNTLRQIGADGTSGYQKLGEKTRATHLNNVDEFGRNGYSQTASKSIIKGNITKAKKGLILDASARSEFYRYKSVVTYLTEKIRPVISSGYTTGLAGTPNAYHIDHNYSIMNGYQNKISPLLIGNINNLTMIPWEENLHKHAASSITLDVLLALTNYTRSQSDSEFNTIMNLIREDISNNVVVSGARILEKLREIK